MRTAESAITLSSDPAPREISGNFPGAVGWQLFKIGDRLPPSRFASSADVDAALNDARAHIDGGHIPRCPARPRLVPSTAPPGADFEETINDVFNYPSDAFANGAISACIV